MLRLFFILRYWRFSLVLAILASLLAASVLRQPAEHTKPLLRAAVSSALNTKSATIWSSTRSLTAEQNAQMHFRKHGREFGLRSADAYIAAATNFLHNPPAGTLTKKQKDGDTVRFRPDTAEFAVMDSAGTPRTYFKLNPDIHGYPSNQAYFDAQ